MPAPLEDLPVTVHHDLYPGIDPTPFYEKQTYRGKVVVISGASRGIGQETAATYARAGAALSLLARSRSALETVKSSIIAECPEARIEIFTVDVTDPAVVEDAIKGTVEKLGRIDIVVANAGKSDAWVKPFTENDPTEWWRTVEVNLRGVYNLAHYTLPHLDQTKGYFVATSSIGSQSRLIYSSPYCTSKHALNRLVEFMTIEHPEVKSFSFHPGAVKTELSMASIVLDQWLVDSVQLPAAFLLQLTSGRFDWLSSRWISANWDLDELERDWKTRIVEQDALVNRLAVPL